MLLTHPIGEISWDDVQAFCAMQLGESAVLDYKQDFPEHLENVVAAMANTSGGAVIIGIAENEQGKPAPPYLGIEFKRGLQEKVQQIVAAHIRPLPDVGVAIAANTDSSRAFVFIRVPQSPLAPHAVDGTVIYVRTGNRNHPEQQATVAQIAWLLNNRARAIELRERLLTQALERSKAMGELNGTTLTLFLCPTYPADPFRGAREMLELYRRIRVPDYYATSDAYPLSHDPRSVQDAAVGVTSIDDAGAFWYAELNTHGLYLTRQTLIENLHPRQARDPDDDDDEENIRADVIRASEIVARVDQFVRSGATFYEAVGYGGPLEFSMRVGNANRCVLDRRLNINEWPDRNRECPDREIRLDLSTTGVALALGDRRRLVLGTIGTIGHAYNVAFQDQQVERYVAEHSRLPLVE